MADGVKFDPNKIQISNTPLNLPVVRVVVTVWTEACKAKESSRMFCAHLSDAVVSLSGIRCAGKRLYDRGINAAFVHPAEQLFLGAQQSEDATFSQVCVSVDYFQSSSHPARRATTSQGSMNGMSDESAAGCLHYGLKPGAGMELLIGVVKVVAQRPGGDSKFARNLCWALALC